MKLRLGIAVAALLLAALLAAAGPYAELRSLMAPRLPFDEAPASSPQQMAAVLHALGEQGRAAYARHLRWDLLLIAAHATALWLWLDAVRGAWLRRWGAAALATAPGIADLVEDAALARLLHDHPALTEAGVTLARVATQAKFAALALALLTAALLTAAALHAAWRRRRSAG